MPSGRRWPQMPKPDPKQDIALWLAVAAPGAFVEEYRFAPPRRYRFDWCAPRPGIMLAVEYEGGVFQREGGHRATGRFLRDVEKYNLAAVMGFRVIRLTAKSVADGTAFEWLERALEERAA